MRASVSAKLMPVARTFTRTCPPRGRSGAGRSRTSSTSGGPCLVMTTARIAWPAYALQTDRAPVHEAVAGDDLLDHLAGHRGVGGDGHGGQPALRTLLLVGQAAHRGRDDVDAVVAEHRPHPADHAGYVGVA